MGTRRGSFGGRVPNSGSLMTHPDQLLEALAAELTSGGDAEYFRYHRSRFRAGFETLQQLVRSDSKVLDVGSHYLHFSSLLAASGLSVTALDVAEFQELDFVCRRAQKYRVRQETVRDLGAGEFLPGVRDSFDVVVFSEILEHITFNPGPFWRRIYDLLRPGGFVFLTTPNSLRLNNVLKTAYRVGARRGVGIPVSEIFQHVTYGHHWKEYSAAELREYFGRLSPDFELEIRFVDYGLEGAPASAPLRAVGNLVPSLRPHMEAVIRLPRKTRWIAEQPRYRD